MTFVIAVAACALLIVLIAALATLALNREKPHGSHARGPQPQDEDRPFADPDEKTDPDEAADEYIAELRGTREPWPEPAPVLAAPVAAGLEPPPPLDRRELSAMPARTAAGMTLPLWEPPADRGTLSTIRDALLAWTPAPVLPQEPEAEPEPWCDPHGENTQQIFQRLVGGQWNPVQMADDIERSVYGSVAAKGRGVSMPGLPDGDTALPQPVHEAGAR
jgi:hypothetical protein